MPSAQTRSLPPPTGCWRASIVDQWRVDPIQAGAGTSHNMNTNEVLANIANESLGGKRGEYKPVHPNDHVNMAQSTNDVFPTAMRIASLLELRELYPALERLQRAFAGEGAASSTTSSSRGARILQDAVPIRLGQEFTAYARTLDKMGAQDRTRAAEAMLELNIGATAAGTGLNSDPRYQKAVVDEAGRADRPAAQARGAPCGDDADRSTRWPRRTARSSCWRLN